MNVRDWQWCALAGSGFTIVFALCTAAFVSNAQSRFGGPLPISGAVWLFAGSPQPDPIAFAVDIVATALLFYPAARFGGELAVALAFLVATAVTFVAVQLAFAPNEMFHVDLIVLWLVPLLVGTAGAYVWTLARTRPHRDVDRLTRFAARNLQAPALGGLGFTFVFAVVTAVTLSDPRGQYGAPLPIGSVPSWIFFERLAFYPLPFLADAVASALLLYPTWRLGGGAGVAIATYVAGAATVALCVAAAANGLLHAELVPIWLASLLIGTAVVGVVRLVRAGVRRTT